MKIALLSTHIRWITHYETELEIIQKHLDKGDEVLHIVCNGELLPCDQNFNKNTDICFNCINRRIVGQNLLKGSYKTVSISFAPTHTSDIKHIDLDEIKLINYKGFDLGYAALSSLISNIRNPEPSNEHLTTLNELIVQGKELFDWNIDFLTKHKPDLVYIFNGRLLHPKSMLRACQTLKIEVAVHERGNNIYHYELFKNTTPHDLKYIETRILHYWNTSSLTEEEKIRIGSTFYEERKSGVEQAWYSFVKQQEANKLPDDWDESKKNILIFNSSEDEFASIGADWKRFVYDSQLEGIAKICEKMTSFTNIHFYLRMHPNLTHVVNENVTSLLNLRFPNLTIIPSASPVSTYALIEKADKVISFGSTVGIEAAYFKKPSVLLGSSFYRNLDSTYNPITEAELLNLLSLDLTPKSSLGAIQYGFYMKTYGIKFEYYKPTGIIEGTFKGKEIYNNKNSSRRLKILKRLGLFKHFIPIKIINTIS